MVLAFNIGFLEIGWVDLVDILLVTILISQIYKLMRGSMAIRVFIGFLVLYLIFLVVRAAQMELLSSILGQFMGVGVIAVFILFQQEIRKFLLLIARTTSFQEGQFVKNIKSVLNASKADHMDPTAIVDAVKSLASSNTGALIVLSKGSELKFYAESGDRMDALLSKRLLISIFNKTSPLHDGAVIIFDGRIVASRCILPVSENTDLPANYGLRHRAALGMSEISDALMIVVSEETGEISTTQNGLMSGALSPQELRRAINNYLRDETPSGRETITKFFRRRAAV